jgi:PAS domain S-box-containing protein
MDREYIATTLREGKSVIGRPVIGRALHSPVLVIAVPIRDAGAKVIGALAGVTDLGKPNFLDNITDGHYGKTDGFLIVAPQHRLIVTASDKSRIMEASPAPSAYPLIDRFLNGFEGTGVHFNPNGVEVMATVKRIPIADWYVNVALPASEAFAPIHAMQKRMLLSAIFLTLLVGGLTWWMLTLLLSPMLLTVRMLAVQADTKQHSQPLPITRQDEIGNLIGGFNHLMETLAQQKAILSRSEERYRLLFQNLTVGFSLHKIILNANGDPCDYRFLEVNPAFEKLTDIKSEKIVGMTALQALPDTEPYWIETYGKAATTGESIHFENYSIALGKHYVVTAYTPEPGKFATIFLDITDSKRAEAALLHLNETLELRVAQERFFQLLPAKQREQRFLRDGADQRSDRADGIKLSKQQYYNSYRSPE